MSVGWSTARHSSKVTTACLIAPSRRTRIRLAIRSLTRPGRRAGCGRRAGLAGVASPAERVSAGEGRGREAEPVLAGELDLAELVADHQLLDRRERHRVDDRLDVEAVAGVRRHRGRRSCAGASGGRPPRARRGCCGPSRWTRRGRSARRAPGCRPAARVVTYSSMTARRIACARRSRGPRGRRSTRQGSFSRCVSTRWVRVLTVCGHRSSRPEPSVNARTAGVPASDRAGRTARSRGAGRGSSSTIRSSSVTRQELRGAGPAEGAGNGGSSAVDRGTPVSSRRPRITASAVAASASTASSPPGGSRRRPGGRAPPT